MPDPYLEGKLGILQEKESEEAGRYTEVVEWGSTLPHLMSPGWDICCRHCCPGLRHDGTVLPEGEQIR